MRLASIYIFLLCTITLSAIPVSATKICLKVVTDSRGRSTVVKRSVSSSRECPAGFTLLVDSTALTGPQGVDGQMRIYGDGSAGAKVVASDETLADTNLNYTNLTVNAGATLTIPSGTVLRLTGSLTNNGTIAVAKGSEGGFRNADSTSIAPAISSPEHGVSTRVAGSSEIGDATNIRSGGAGGIGLTLFEAAQIRYPGTNAGGAGGCADPRGHGSDGGGSLVVIAKGAVVNNALITALGEGPLPASTTSGGGGGGGIVILASLTSVTNAASGVMHADGGDGAEADTNQGPSGGGGGGIIHLLAPQVANLGFATADAGADGASVGVGFVSDTPRGGGGGGGACAGNGGSGGSVNTNGQANVGQSGDDGYVILTTTEPTFLF